MISIAWAQSGGDSAFGGFEVLLPMVLVFVVFYFLLIRPQQKKVKAHQNKLSAIVKGDEVLTGGGFYGKVIKAEDNDLWIRLADGVEVRVLRSTVMDKLEKGTIKGSAKGGDKKEKTTKAKPAAKLAVNPETKKATKSGAKKASKSGQKSSSGTKKATADDDRSEDSQTS